MGGILYVQKTFFLLCDLCKRRSSFRILILLFERAKIRLFVKKNSQNMTKFCIFFWKRFQKFQILLSNHIKHGSLLIFVFFFNGRKSIIHFYKKKTLFVRISKEVWFYFSKKYKCYHLNLLKNHIIGRSNNWIYFFNFTIPE